MDERQPCRLPGCRVVVTVSRGVPLDELRQIVGKLGLELGRVGVRVENDRAGRDVEVAAVAGESAEVKTDRADAQRLEQKREQVGHPVVTEMISVA